MAIDWSHLPIEVLAKVCLCNKQTKTYTRTQDPVSKLFVHTGKDGCNKPPPLTTTILECDLCEKPFVVKNYQESKMSFLGAMCQGCENDF